MAVTVTIEPAGDASRPNVVTIAGGTPGQVFRLSREYGTKVEMIRGSLIAGAGPPESLFTADNTPLGSDVGTFELGEEFETSIDGTVTGIRFYRTAGDTLTSRQLSLWNTAGVLLGSVVTTGETGSGWRTVNLPAPVAVPAGRYIVSYPALSSLFSFLSAHPVRTTAHLTAINSRFAQPPGYPAGPTNVFYFVDVVFQPAGTVSYSDFLYPLDTPLRYAARDSTGSTVLAISALVPPVASVGFPWVRDTMFPESRASAVRIVTVHSRRYAARVTPFTVINQKYPVTAGDVRSGSDGSIVFFCLNHHERDVLIEALSSGNPCWLRIPPRCQVAFDEMVFTPLDIDEEMFGANGSNILTVDFLEVSPSELAPYRAVDYGIQTANAAGAAMTYGQLEQAFVGHTYSDLYYSETGVAP